MIKRALAALLVLCAMATLSGCYDVNMPPVAVFSWTINQLAVSFDAGPSYDEDGYLTTCLWDFGDGSISTGEQVSHTYSSTSARTYQVMLTVTDNDGATGTVTNSIQVTPPAPTPPAPTPPAPTPPAPTPPAPTPGGSGIEVRVTASESEIDILGYAIETQGLWTLVGQAKNVSNESFSSVFISARMLDSAGMVIETDIDLQSDVTPGMTYEFTLWLLEEERIAVIEIYEISTYSW